MMHLSAAMDRPLLYRAARENEHEFFTCFPVRAAGTS